MRPVVQAALYGGTWELVHNELVRLGVAHTIVDCRDARSWRAALQPRTKVRKPARRSQLDRQAGAGCKPARWSAVRRS